MNIRREEESQRPLLRAEEGGGEVHVTSPSLRGPASRRRSDQTFSATKQRGEKKMEFKMSAKQTVSSGWSAIPKLKLTCAFWKIQHEMNEKDFLL